MNGAMNFGLRGKSIVLGAALILALGCAARPLAADPPAPAPPAQTQPATTQISQPPHALSPASSAEEILDALDVRGVDLKDFSATVSTADTDPATGDSTVNRGKLLFQRKDPHDARFRITFEDRINGDRITHQKHEYTLDNGWLIERDYDAKKEIRRQVVKLGEKVDLLKIGSGPFPLPIGQKKEDVLNLFEVKKIDLAKDDPPNTVCIGLTPRAGTPYARKFKSVYLWIDPTNSMPRRITTVDSTGATEKTTDLTDMKINPGLDNKDFAQTDLPAGWDQIVEPYGE